MSARDLAERAGKAGVPAAGVVADDGDDDAVAAVAGFIGEEPNAKDEASDGLDDDAAEGDEADEEDAQLTRDLRTRHNLDEDDDEAEETQTDDGDHPAGKEKAGANGERTKLGADYARGDDDGESKKPVKGKKSDLDTDELANQFGDVIERAAADESPSDSAATKSPPPKGASEQNQSDEQRSSDDTEKKGRGLFTPDELKALDAEYEPGVAKVLKAAHTAVGRLQEQVDQLERHATARGRHEMLEAARSVRQFFSRKAQEGFGELVGTDPRKLNQSQDQVRARVIRAAVAVRKELAAAGDFISIDEAMDVAFTGLRRKDVEKKAADQGRREVQETIRRRHRAIDLSASGRAPHERGRARATAGSADAEAVGAVDGWLRKRGLA